MLSDKKLRRLALYKRDEVRRLVEQLLKSKSDLRPQRDPVTGDYVFEVEGLDAAKAYALLGELEGNAILEKYRFYSVPTCPTCKHSNFYVSYACPTCQNRNLERTTLIEHYRCGHTDTESSFSSGDRLVCPGCLEELKSAGTDCRRIQGGYRCLSCMRHFAAPSIELSCLICKKPIPTDTVQMTPTFGYKINERLRSELLAHCSLSGPIIDLLTRLGYEAEGPWSKKGMSGEEHLFDIHAWKDGSEIVIDVTSGREEIGPEGIATFFGKAYDSNPGRAILIAMPGLNKNARRLSALYQTEVVSGASIEDVLRSLEGVLKNIAGIRT
jgi:hypothetical protein